MRFGISEHNCLPKQQLRNVLIGFVVLQKVALRVKDTFVARIDTQHIGVTAAKANERMRGRSLTSSLTENLIVLGRRNIAMQAFMYTASSSEPT